MRTFEAREELRNYIEDHCKNTEELHKLDLLPVLGHDHEDSYVTDESVTILDVSVNEKGVESITTRLWTLSEFGGWSYLDNKYLFKPEIVFE